VKEIEKKGVVFTANKIKDDALPDWIAQYCEGHGLQLHFQEAQLLAANLGNDLRKIANEIDKLRLNLPAGQTELTPQLIQKHIGVSKEYNVFAFPEALTGDNAEQRHKMLSYFIANPKAAPPPLMVAALYGHFEKLYARHYAQGKSQQEVAAALGLTEKTAWKAKEYFQRPRYSLAQIEECLVILAEWSGKAVGIESNMSDAGWLKEVTARIELVLGQANH
jgi:DNA polymerase-3 subunit delta